MGALIALYMTDAPPSQNTHEECLNLLELPAELLLIILSNLDATSLSVVGRTCRRLREIAADSQLWSRLPLSLGMRPRPPRVPSSLSVLRICSHRCASPELALDWLHQGGCRSLRRLELVGRPTELNILRICVKIFPQIQELSLHDIAVNEDWIPVLRQLQDIRVLLLDWLTMMPCSMIEEVANACPKLREVRAYGPERRGELHETLLQVRRTQNEVPNLKVTSYFLNSAINTPY